VIVFRHGGTDADQADTDPLNPDNVAKQRGLTTRAAPMRRPSARRPDSGTNTLIGTHQPNIRDALGKDGFDVREGEASIGRRPSNSH
jgi:hypothetical protein